MSTSPGEDRARGWTAPALWFYAAGQAGFDAFSFQFVTPESPWAAALVSYAAVYLLAGWILGGHVRPDRG